MTGIYTEKADPRETFGDSPPTGSGAVRDRSRILSSLRKVRLQNFVWLLIAVSLLWMILGPLWVVADSATRSETELGLGAGRSLEALKDVYTSAEYVNALINAMVLAAVVTAISLIVGTAAAFVVARVDLPAPKTLDTLLILPLFMSPFIGLVAWVSLASPKSGYLRVVLDPIEKVVGSDVASFVNIWSYQGIVWVMTIFFVPWAYLFTVGSMRSMDASLEESAQMSGASKIYTLRRVTLPLSAPSIFAGGLLVFILAAEMYTIPGIIGGTTGFKSLPWQIYQDARVFPLQQAHAAAAGTLLLWITLAGILLQRRFTRISDKFVTISGKGFKPKAIEVGRWKYPIVGLIVFYALMAVVLPIGALLAASFMKYTSTDFSRDLFTTMHYQQFFTSPALIQGLINSAVLAVVSAAICVGIGYFLSHNEIRYPSWSKRAFALVAIVPVAIPGLVLGFGFLLAFIKSPLYSTLLLLLLAHIVRLLPYGVLTSRSAILSVDGSLEEAAHVLGASRLYTMRRVSLPLARGALVSVFIFMMLLSIKELSASIFLVGAGNPLLSVEIWSSMQGGEYQLAAAMSVVQTLLTLTIIGFARVFLRVGLRDMAK